MASKNSNPNKTDSVSVVDSNDCEQSSTVQATSQKESGQDGGLEPSDIIDKFLSPEDIMNTPIGEINTDSKDSADAEAKKPSKSKKVTTKKKTKAVTKKKASSEKADKKKLASFSKT